MTNAISAFGTSITWNSQTVGEISNIGGPDIKVDMIDVTSHAATSGFREFIAGLADAGEITIEGNWYPGDTNGQKAMVDDCIAKTSRTIVITGPTAAAFTWTCTARISQISPTLPHDDKMGFSMTIKITGVPTFAVTVTADLTTLTGIEENTGAALTFTPAFDGAVYDYNIAINTASTYIKLTPTLATSTTVITTSAASSSQSVASGAQSGTIAVTDGAVTTVRLSVTTSGKVAKIYTLHVYTP